MTYYITWRIFQVCFYISLNNLSLKKQKIDCPSWHECTKYRQWKINIKCPEKEPHINQARKHIWKKSTWVKVKHLAASWLKANWSLLLVKTIPQMQNKLFEISKSSWRCFGWETVSTSFTQSEKKVRRVSHKDLLVNFHQLMTPNKLEKVSQRQTGIITVWTEWLSVASSSLSQICHYFPLLKSFLFARLTWPSLNFLGNKQERAS